MNLKNKNNQMILSSILACFLVIMMSVVFVPEYSKYFFIGFGLLILTLSCFYKMEDKYEVNLKDVQNKNDLPPYQPKSLQLIILILICSIIVFICVRLVVPVEYGTLCTILFLVIIMPVALKGNQLLLLRKLHKQSK
ncbi:hypothetical protein ROU88_10975 [Macrococcus capreoli]